MNDKKILFAATDGIADEYLQEAIKPWFLVPSQTIKRLTAIAAMIAIVLTALFVLPVATNTTPVFVIRVGASEKDEQTLTVGSPPVSMNSIYTSVVYEHLFSDIWEQDAFCFKICREYTFWDPQNYDTDVVIEYSGKNLSSKQQKDSSFRFYYTDTNLAVFPVDYEKRPQDSYLCVHGWLEETTDLKIHLYVTQSNSRKLVQTIFVRVSVDKTSWTGYTLEVIDITTNDQEKKRCRRATFGISFFILP